MNISRSRVNRSKAVLFVVDIQEKLLPAMFEKERVLQRSMSLIKGAQVLKVPVLVTEQYRKGLGATVPQIATVIDGFSPEEKLSFSACGAENCRSAVASRTCSDVILCGIECHVCVTQTCLDLLDSGLRVFVVADATSSRKAEDYQAGIDRMRSAGAVSVSTEMILFELLEKAGNEEFKKVLALVK